MPSSIIERVVRHRLPEEQLGALVDMLTVMLEAPVGKLQISYIEGDITHSASVPAAALELMLDAISLLASRNRAAVMAVDDGLEVNANDVCSMLARGHKATQALLSRYEVPVSDRKSGQGNWYLLSDVIDAFREDKGRERKSDDAGHLAKSSL